MGNHTVDCDWCGEDMRLLDAFTARTHEDRCSENPANKEKNKARDFTDADPTFNGFNIEFRVKGKNIHKKGIYLDISCLTELSMREIQGAADALMAAHKLKPGQLEIAFVQLSENK